MATQTDLMGLGTSWPLAERLGYTPVAFTGVATVTTQSGSTALESKLCLLTTSTSTAVAYHLSPTAPPGTFVYVTNLFASTATATVFCATGQNMNGVTNGSLALTTGQSALFINEVGGTAAAVQWYSIKSA